MCNLSPFSNRVGKIVKIQITSKLIVSRPTWTEHSPCPDFGNPLFHPFGQPLVPTGIHYQSQRKYRNMESKDGLYSCQSRLGWGFQNAPRLNCRAQGFFGPVVVTSQIMRQLPPVILLACRLEDYFIIFYIPFFVAQYVLYRWCLSRTQVYLYCYLHTDMSCLLIFVYIDRTKNTL